MARQDGHIPRVLFSTPECRGVVVELDAGEEMGDHHVRERAIVQVIRGRVEIDASGESADCAAGTLVVFDCGERHSVRALDDSMLLLMLAPWPGAQHLPQNASVEPEGA